MEVGAEGDWIAIRLTSKPDERLDSSEIDTCLDHTVSKIGDSAQPAEG